MKRIFEVGKVYFSGGDWFRCVKRALVGVPNMFMVSFESNVFPYEFSVRVRSNEYFEFFGGQHVVYSLAPHEFKSIDEEFKTVCDIKIDFPIEEDNIRFINGRLTHIGYCLFKSDTSGKWSIKSDTNISYFNSEMFGEFKTVGLAFEKLYGMISSEIEQRK